MMDYEVVAALITLKMAVLASLCFLSLDLLCFTKKLRRADAHTKIYLKKYTDAVDGC